MTNETQLSPVAAFRAKMAAGDICIGASITLTDPHATDALGDSVDFFWIDMEHSMMSAEALGGHFLAAKARSRPALVRVPGSGDTLYQAGAGRGRGRDYRAAGALGG